MIAAVIMRNDGGVSPKRKLPNGNEWLDIANADEYETSVVVICHEVERALSWATREEIHKAIYRMAPNHRRPEMHRILPKAHPTRAIPLYVFGRDDASHDASPSPENPGRARSGLRLPA